MSETKMGRRDAARRALFVLGAAALAPSALSACGGGELTCTDTSALSSADMQTRSTQMYSDHSRDPAKKCNQCRFFTAGQAANTCGSCQVLRGPIHPDGSCNLFSART